MESYLDYVLIFKPKSTTLTPFHSDTIFGSLMWALKYIYSEKRLVQVLEAFYREPLFLLSSAFPENCLPLPFLPFPIKEDVTESEVSKAKELKRVKYIKSEELKRIINEISPDALLSVLEKKDLNQDRIFTSIITSSSIKNVINRLTFGTIESGLFHQQEQAYDNSFNWYIYLRLNNSQDLINLEEINKLFDFISLSGFGKRKSTGKGSFKIIDLKPASLPKANYPNAFIALSNFVPKAEDPTSGFYDFFVKYGKVGGDFALGYPWKKPLVMFKPGSIFKLENELKPYYGGMVPKVYPPVDTVCQYGYCFPLGVRLIEEVYSQM